MRDSELTRGQLGPNQLAWLKKHIPAFDIAWRAVQASQAHASKVYAQMGVEKGSIGDGTATQGVQVN